MKSEFQYFELIKFDEQSILSKLSKRDGETKLGEKIMFDFSDSSCKYVVLGISEDIGPQANFGFGGSDKAFSSFLPRFLNVQSNRFLSGQEICLYGEIKQTNPFYDIDEARTRIEVLDNFVQSIAEPIIAAGKILIVIGGGHNNAYPLIKSVFGVTNEAIDVFNLDPHSDCRALEGRHSGNPFSYAVANGYLKNYTVLGLHQQYNSESLLNYLDQHSFSYSFYEDYLDGTRDFKSNLQSICSQADSDRSRGIELDMDSIVNMPSSAYTPSGFSVAEARIYMRTLAKLNNIAYIHLPEGAPRNENEEKIVGKTLVYLVVDFIKVNNSRK